MKNFATTFFLYALCVSVADATLVDLTGPSWAGLIEQPGYTNRLNGTFTNSYPGGTNSGTATQPITLLFATGAKFSAPYWNPAAITLDTVSNIVVDGGANGLIEAASNGTGLAYTNRSVGIKINAGYSNTVKNVTISKMYVRTAGSGENSPDSEFGAFTTGIWLVGGSWINILNNAITGGSEGGMTIQSWAGGSTNHDFTIFGNRIENNCISIVFAGSGTVSNGVFYNLNIVSNRFDHWSMWAATAPGSSNLHRDGIYMFLVDGVGTDSGTCVISNVVISHNYFGPDVCAPGTAGGTAAMFMTWYSTNVVLPIAFDMRVFNNVLVWTNKSDSQTPWADGFLACNAGGNSIIANNTLISVAFQHGDGYTYGQGSAMGAVQNPIKIFGNLLVDFSTQIGFDPNCGQTNYNAGFMSDSNCFARPFTAYIGSGNDFFSPPAIAFGSSQGQGWMDWTNTQFVPGMRFDNGSHTNMPLISLTTYQPLTNDTILIGKGPNLISWGIVNDFNGNPRPTNGNWTIGAFEGGTNQPAPPDAVAFKPRFKVIFQ